MHQRTPHHYRVNQMATYCDYIERLRALELDPRMPAFQTGVNGKVDYPVSGRARSSS